LKIKIACLSFLELQPLGSENQAWRAKLKMQQRALSNKIVKLFSTNLKLWNDEGFHLFCNIVRPQFRFFQH